MPGIATIILHILSRQKGTKINLTDKMVRIFSKGIYPENTSHLLILLALFFNGVNIGFAQTNVHSIVDNSKAIDLYKNGQYVTAINAFTELIKADKNDTAAYAYRGLSE